MDAHVFPLRLASKISHGSASPSMEVVYRRERGGRVEKVDGAMGNRRGRVKSREN
jgi:hypothetical protein